MQGALNIKKKVPDAILIYMLPPGAQILHERLKGRGTETNEVIAKRMLRAAQEAVCVSQYDYIIVNNDVDECAASLHALIRAQRLRVRSNLPFIRKLTKELTNLSEKGE